MTLRLATVLVAVLHAVPALAADFEGTADMRIVATGDRGQKAEGTGKLYVTAKAWRMESEMTIPEGSADKKALGGAEGFRTVAIGKAAEPRKTWMVNDRTKTYAVVESDPERGRDRDAKEYAVTRAGKDTVAGLACEKVNVQKKGKDEVFEGCFTRELLSGAWLRALEGAEREGWVAAAHRAGVAGFPARVVSRGKEGTEKLRMEIVKVERKSLPASLFEVPAGYRETSAMGTMAQTPEQQKQMDDAQKQMEEAMKNMPPEQRKMMEEMMKKQGQRK
jgi:hypothetical protein